MVENPGIITAAEDFVRKIFEDKIPADIYTYHNWVHTVQVRDEVLLLARMSGVTAEELEMLNLAALFHDIGFSEVYSGHEDKSKEIAGKFLRSQQYPEERIRIILDLIEATKLETKPITRLQALIKDADTSSLGRSHFQIYTNSLRKELNAVQHAVLSKKDWAQANLRFLEEHEYYSPEGKQRYEETKQENKKSLVTELKSLGNNPEWHYSTEAKRAGYVNTIANSRTAQTQFKTALRNHIDLSSIADNKANIMLSVNALIITFALPLLGKEIFANQILLFPSILLLTTCVLSMIFATLATRPIPMLGYSSKENIMNKKANLFFFGNFYKMSFEEYEEGMNATIADDDILDVSIMRDLYSLGRTLGRKYTFLRRCYNIFMYGIIASVLAFVIVFSVIDK